MKKTIISAVLLTMLGASAYAQTEPSLDFGKNTEITLSTGYAHAMAEPQLKFAPKDTPVQDDDSAAFQVSVSTSLTKDVKVEAFAGRMSTFGTAYKNRPTSYLKWHELYAGVGLSAPLFQKDAHTVNFKSGVAVVSARSNSFGLDSETTGALVFGLEYKYKVNKHYSVGGQVQYFTDLAAPGSSAPVYSLAVSYAL